MNTMAGIMDSETAELIKVVNERKHISNMRGQLDMLQKTNNALDQV